MNFFLKIFTGITYQVVCKKKDKRNYNFIFSRFNSLKKILPKYQQLKYEEILSYYVYLNVKLKRKKIANNFVKMYPISNSCEYRKINFHKKICRVFAITYMMFLFIYKRYAEASMQEVPPNYVDPDGEIGFSFFYNRIF